MSSGSIRGSIQFHLCAFDLELLAAPLVCFSTFFFVFS